MKMAPLLGSSALVVTLFAAPSSHAQSSPTKLAQPAVNANAQNQANINAEATRDPRFSSRYGSARPSSAAPTAPAPVPVAVAAPAAVAAPVAPVPQAQPPAEDPRFSSRYGSARPRAAQAAAPAAPAAAPRATVAPGAPASAPGATAVPAAAPAPVRKADPEREQRIINFQRQNAASGNPSAQYDLGMRYLRGNGVDKDESQAMEWLKLAAQNGDGRAKKELATLQAKAGAVETPAPAKASETK